MRWKWWAVVWGILLIVLVLRIAYSTYTPATRSSPAVDKLRPSPVGRPVVAYYRADELLRLCRLMDANPLNQPPSYGQTIRVQGEFVSLGYMQDLLLFSIAPPRSNEQIVVALADKTDRMAHLKPGDSVSVCLTFREIKTPLARERMFSGGELD